MSLEIKIPFKARFWPKIESGDKTMTCRGRRYGEPGDYFLTPAGTRIVLTRVEPVKLGYVAEVCFREEGCDSKEQFIATWNEIHPYKGFDPKQTVIAHYFVRTDPRR